MIINTWIYEVCYTFDYYPYTVCVCVCVRSDCVTPCRAIVRAANSGYMQLATVSSRDRRSTEPRAGSTSPVADRHHRLRCPKLPVGHGELHGSDVHCHEQA